MFKSYLLVAVRNLRRNKLFSGINLIGLAVGMASAMLIGLWVRNEMGFDQFHQKKDRLYMMFNLSGNPGDEGSGAWSSSAVDSWFSGDKSGSSKSDGKPSF